MMKALSFMFEYIGVMAKDYIYAVAPLMEDSLSDRDRIHRQTAMVATKHIALGVVGLGCEDALIHIFNFVWPNIFEEAQHVCFAAMEAVEAMAVALGPGRVLQYVLQGLYHPARKVRETYWKMYNTLYIYGADGMIPYLPRIEDDGVNTYRRTHLELFI